MKSPKLEELKGKIESIFNTTQWVDLLREADAGRSDVSEVGRINEKLLEIHGALSSAKTKINKLQATLEAFDNQ